MADKTITLTLKTIADINDVTQRAKDIQAALDKIQLPQKLKTSLETTFNELYRDVEKASEAMKSGFKTKGDVTKYERSINNINSSLTKLYTNINNIDATKLEIKTDTKEFKDLEQRINNIKENLKDINVNEVQKLQNLLKNPPSGAAAWNEFLEAVSAAEPDFEAAEKALRKLSHQVANHQEQIKAGDDRWKQYSNTVSQMSEGLKVMKQNIADNAQELINLNKEQKNLETKAFEEQAQEVDKTKDSMRELTVQTEEFGKAEIDAKRASQQLGAELDQFKSRITYFFGLNNAVRLFQRAVKSAYTTIQDLDKVMTETAVVTNFSVGDMWTKLPQYTEQANKLGVTIHDVYESSTLYYQQGLKTNEVMSLTNATLKMARIAGLEAAEATDRMTNALRGFNMEINETNANRVADVYSKLAAMSASNVDEISTAMTKVASLANSANMQFETTAAFLSQIIETTRESAETAGTALKTVVARFSEVKKLYTEGELFGTDDEGEAVDVNKVSAALKTAGISLNEFLTGAKGLDDIFMELASKWDTLDTVQQRYIATMAAGSRQQSRFIAMMQDYKRTTELVDIAQNAAGASQEQYQKTLESLETKLNKLKNSWNTFLMGILNSTVVKFIVDSLRTIIDLANKVTGILPGILGSFGKITVAFGAFKFGKKVLLEKFIMPILTAIRTTGKVGAAQAEVEGLLIGKKYGEGIVAGANYNSILGANNALVLSINAVGTAEGRLNTIRTATIPTKEELIALDYSEAAAEDTINIAKQYQNTIITRQVPLLKAEELAKFKEAVASGDDATANALLNIELEREEFLRKKGLLGLVRSLTLKRLGVDVTKAETLQEQILNATKLKGANATKILNAEMLITVGYLAAIAAGIALVVYLYSQLSLEGRLKKANKALEENTEKAAEAVDTYKQLRDGLNSLDDYTSTFASLKKGTEAWYEALQKVNEQVLTLIDKYPELAEHVQVDENGQMYFEEADQAQVEEIYKKRVNEAQYTKAKSQVQVRNLENQKAERNARNTLASYEDYNGNSLLSSKDIDKLFAIDKAAISEADVAEALGEETAKAMPWMTKVIANTINQAKNAQQANNLKAEAGIKSTLSTILGNEDYGNNTNLVKLLVTADTVSRFNTVEDLQKNINQFIDKNGNNNLVKRVLSGETQAGDLAEFEKDEDLKKALENLGINIQNLITQLQQQEKGAEERKQKLSDLGLESDWATGAGATTQQNIIDKLGGDKYAAKIIDDFMTTSAKEWSPKDKEEFIKTLFSSEKDWGSLEEWDKLQNQLEILGVDLKGVDLQPLITQLAQLNKAISTKATAAVLSSNIKSQGDLISAVDSGEAFEDTQKSLATAAGVPEDQFVMTAAGWVYTGDPDELVKKLQQSNANTFQKAANNYNVNPNDSTIAELNQMAQIMGANGQIADTSGINQNTSFDGLSDWEIDDQLATKYIQDERAKKEAIEENIKGLKVYAEANSEVYDAVLKYEKAMKSSNKKEQEKAKLVLQTVMASERDTKQFKSLTDVINDYSDALKEGNKKSKNYTTGLSKVAQSASKAFNTKITSEFVEKNKDDFVKLADGDTKALDRIRGAIKDNLITGLVDSEDEAKNLNDALSGISSLTLDINGTADFTDIFNKIEQLVGGAEEAKKFLANLGYTVEYKANEDGSGFTARLTDTANNYYKSLRDGRNKGGGTKQKYWDNPYDELYNKIEKQNELLRTREKLEREYDRILKNRSKSAKELLQNSLDEIKNLQKEIKVQEEIQAGRRRMINNLGTNGYYRNSEGKKKSFNQWGVTKYASYDYNTNQIKIDWAGIDKINDPDKGAAVEAYISKLEELTQSFEETQDQIEEMKDTIQEIKERNMQEYLDFEQRAYDAVLAREQKVIDEYSALSDVIDDSNSRILDGLRESIDLERQIRDNTKTEEDIADKEARLAYLRRDTSGANQTEIMKLEEELKNARESYGDTLIDQAIDNLEKENEKASEQRQQQIKIMKAQLDWSEETGAFWEEIYDLFGGAFDEEGKVIEDSELFNLIRAAEGYRGMSKYGKQNFNNEGVQQAKQAYEGEYNWEQQTQSGSTSVEQPSTPAPAPAPTTSAKGKIKGAGAVAPNYKTADVKKLQEGINDLIRDGKINLPLLDEDGKYGPKTTEAVRALQKLIGFTGSDVDGRWGKNSAAKFASSTFNQYEKGGLVNSTGLAWLDGTKSSPEMVLSARDTENFIALRNALSQMLAQGGGKGGDNYFDIQINVDELGSDYDVDQLANRIKKQIYDDSSYRNVNAISYLR